VSANPEKTAADRGGRMRLLGQILVTAAVYFAAAKLGLRLAFVAEQVTVVWPPTGIALAALVVFGPRLWPGIALGAFAANATANETLAMAAAIATGNTLEGVAAAWMLRRLDFRPQLDRLRDVLALTAAGALVSPIVSATIGVVSLCAGGLESWKDSWSLWSVWWLGDAIGALIVAPLLLVWSKSVRSFDRQHWDELAALLVASCFANLVLFAGTPSLGLRGYPLHYVVFPFVVWAALRLRQAGTTAVTCAASCIAIWSTAHGLGPFAMGTIQESLLMCQLFMGVVAATGLLLGAAIAERDAAWARQRSDLAALETSEGRLRLALEAGRLGVWEWDIPTGTVQWTDNLETIHGLPHGSFGGTLAAFQALVHPDDRPRVDEAIRKALEEGESYDNEFRTIWPDGSLHWVAAKGTMIADAEGRPLRLVGTATEVTERRRLDRQLRERAEELAEADRRKDEFLAMLAHELRNPLAPLSTSLHLIATNPAERERSLEMAERQVRHLVRLVDDLLDVSRISRGKVTLQREPVSLADVVDHAVEVARPLIEAQGHALTVSLPSEPVRLIADPVRLAQVIANLLNNAANYTPPGGSIWVTAETAGDELTLRVRDTGMGLKPELVPRIFDLFVQGESTLDRTSGGLGIGLTLAKGLVELHGGRVEAHSGGVGQGSEFIVRLPTLSAGLVEPSPVRAAGSTPMPANPIRILIVEDNHDTAESLSTLLGMWGHEVKIAFDGVSALAAAQSFKPDMILSDLGLPGMDGYELASRLRQEPAFGRVVLVALSGYGREEDRQRSLQAGFDHHQAKPLDVAWLYGLVGRVAAARGDDRPRTLQ
jgi:PAS domain S-box-containing protein